jgi:hypothetical protein
VIRLPASIELVFCLFDDHALAALEKALSG